MSGIAAVIRFDGGPVAPGTIERMTEAMAYRGPDGIAHWQRGPVALGHCMLRTTAEPLEEVQPLANEDESLVLVMDGYLTNWEELRSELLTRGARLRTRSDAELVLRAYEAWGEDCPRHIDGEYAFLVWDARRREAYCARDHAGLRSLHYHWDGKRLVMASDVVGVLAVPDVPQLLNRGMVAETLTFDHYSRDETMWENVRRGLSGHWTRFGASGTVSGQYWSLPTEVSLRYWTDEEYFEHYRALFLDCVRRAGRTHLPLSCDVSGGHDSSAVFAAAHHLQHAGKLTAPQIIGHTYLSEPGSRGDEIVYARAVAAHVGAPVREVTPFMPDLDWFVQRGQEDRDVPPSPNMAMAVAIGDAMREEGSRVSLTGEGGDEWLGGKAWNYWEQIEHRDWSAFAESFQEDVRDFGLADTIRSICRHGLAPRVPLGLLKLRHWLRSPGKLHEYDRPYWLTRDVEAIWLERRKQRNLFRYHAIRNPARRAMAMVFHDAFVGLSHERIVRLAARSGYEQRFPMYAREFIEFAFKTPERIRRRGNFKKFVHLRAIGDLLPEIVATRRSKAEFSLAFTRQLDTMQTLLVEALPRVENSHLDPNGMARLYNSYRQAPDGSKPIWCLWGIFSCEGVLAAPIASSK